MSKQSYNKLKICGIHKYNYDYGASKDLRLKF